MITQIAVAPYNSNSAARSDTACSPYTISMSPDIDPKPVIWIDSVKWNLSDIATIDIDGAKEIELIYDGMTLKISKRKFIKFFQSFFRKEIICKKFEESSKNGSKS